MSKLQKFLNLGDYYASNGGYLEKKTAEYLDDFKKNAGYNNYTKFFLIFQLRYFTMSLEWVRTTIS